jgi:hypothetical protein
MTETICQAIFINVGQSFVRLVIFPSHSAVGGGERGMGGGRRKND